MPLASVHNCYSWVLRSALRCRHERLGAGFVTHRVVYHVLPGRWGEGVGFTFLG